MYPQNFIATCAINLPHRPVELCITIKFGSPQKFLGWWALASVVRQPLLDTQELITRVLSEQNHRQKLYWIWIWNMAPFGSAPGGEFMQLSNFRLNSYFEFKSSSLKRSSSESWNDGFQNYEISIIIHCVVHFMSVWLPHSLSAGTKDDL